VKKSADRPTCLSLSYKAECKALSVSGRPVHKVVCIQSTNSGAAISEHEQHYTRSQFSVLCVSQRVAPPPQILLVCSSSYITVVDAVVSLREGPPRCCIQQSCPSARRLHNLTTSHRLSLFIIIIILPSRLMRLHPSPYTHLVII
jgi:hypothetical protein